MLIDRKSRIPRLWSNKELLKFAHLFFGDILNVSGWKDKDKCGKKYKDYFIYARSYTISNFDSAEKMGFTGFKGEIKIDLTKEIESHYINKFDVIFNHTTLEHIYPVRKAFSNLCALSRDIVIIVVPFLQIFHGEECGGDFWRFTPFTIKNLFEENNLKLLYLNFNNHRFASVYIFAIGSKNPSKWGGKIYKKMKFKKRGKYLGQNAMPKFPYLITLRYSINQKINRIISLFSRKKK